MPEAKIKQGNLEITISGDGSSITVKNFIIPFPEKYNKDTPENRIIKDDIRKSVNPVMDILLKKYDLAKREFIDYQIETLSSQILMQKNLIKILTGNKPITTIFDIEGSKVTYISNGLSSCFSTMPQFKNDVKKGLLSLRNSIIESSK